MNTIDFIKYVNEYVDFFCYHIIFTVLNTSRVIKGSDRSHEV